MILLSPFLQVDGVLKTNRDLFPSLDRLRNVTREIGIAVAETVIQEGNSRLKSIDSVEKLIDDVMWYPDYPIYTRK